MKTIALLSLFGLISAETTTATTTATLTAATTAPSLSAETTEALSKLNMDAL